MKNDREHHRRPREPMTRGDTVSQSNAEWTCHCDQKRCLSMRCRSHPERLSKKETLSFRSRFIGREIFLLFRFLTTRYGIRNDRSDFLDNPEPARYTYIKEAGGGSATVNQILRPTKAGLRMTDSLSGDPPLGKPPTGFSELDVGERPNNSVTLNLFQGLKNRCRTEFGMTDRLCGEPPEVECDIGLVIECCQELLAHQFFGGSPDSRKSNNIGLVMDTLLSAESETTWLTGDEIRNGCCLTMDSTRFQLCQN